MTHPAAWTEPDGLHVEIAPGLHLPGLFVTVGRLGSRGVATGQVLGDPAPVVAECLASVRESEARRVAGRVL